MSIEQSESTRALWEKRKAKLSRDAFVKQYPYPFLLVGEVAEGVSDDFFTQQANTPALGGVLISEDHEVIPLLKGAANPYSDRIIIGRARNCDIVFRNSSVSKVHADLQVLGPDACDVIDRGSTNGTFVGRDRIAVRTKAPVKSGQPVCFGMVRCVFVSAGELYDML